MAKEGFSELVASKPHLMARHSQPRRPDREVGTISAWHLHGEQQIQKAGEWVPSEGVGQK